MNARSNVSRWRLGAWWGVPLLILFTACGDAASEPAVGAFPYVRAATHTGPFAHEMGRIDVDEEIYACTKALDADMRIHADRREVPFVVRRKMEHEAKSRERNWTGKVESFNRLDDGQVELVVGWTNRAVSVNALVFDTRLRDFEKQVTVFREDGQTWVPIAAAQPIFDYSRFVDVRNVRVDIPATRALRFKVVIGNITEQQQSPLVQLVRDKRGGAVVGEQERLSFRTVDFRIDGIRFASRTEHVDTRGPALRDYSVEAIEVHSDSKKKETVVTWRTRKTPVTEVEFVTPDENFSRPVRIEGRDDDADGQWRMLASTTISRVKLGDFSRDSITVSLGGARRFSEYRAVLRDEDSPPLTLESVKARGETHELLFFHKGVTTLTVCFGGTNVPRPRYDIAGVLGSRAETVEADVYTLEKPGPNPAYTGQHREPPNTKLFLIAVVLLTVGVLGYLIARMARSLPPSTENRAE